MLQILTLFLLLISGCQNSSTERGIWIDIPERSPQQEMIYRVNMPTTWEKKSFNRDESLEDTKKPNAEFFIREGRSFIRITIHTFPFQGLETRIPPQAQIARWKQQLEPIDPLSYSSSSCSHGGFSGLFFEGEGTHENQRVKVIGWSMQLAPLFLPHLPEGLTKRADYTIKASGPPSLIDKYRKEIIHFGNSFELIDELPSP